MILIEKYQIHILYFAIVNITTTRYMGGTGKIVKNYFCRNLFKKGGK